MKVEIKRQMSTLWKGRTGGKVLRVKNGWGRRKSEGDLKRLQERGENEREGDEQTGGS